MRLTTYSIRVAWALLWGATLAALPALAHQVQSDAVPGGQTGDHDYKAIKTCWSLTRQLVV